MRSPYAIFATALAVASPAAGHHSARIFDTTSIVSFVGTVTRFEWTNPHVYIYVETRDNVGDSIEWEIETDATPILSRSGWTADSLKAGELVRVRANPDRNAERKHALLVSVAREDGVVLAPRSYFLRKPDEFSSAARASDLSGVWELRFSDYRQFYERWDEVALTEKGAAARETYDVRRDSPEADCIPIPSPGVLVAPYLNEIEVLQDRILIRNERFNLERIIHMDGRGHPENGEPTNQGHSIGRWEGDVLVVDTVQFEPHRSPILASGVPSGAQKHVVERMTLSGDGTRILIDFLLEDPEHLAEPFAGTVEWYYAPHFEMQGFGCDPEVSSRYTLE